MKRRNVQEAFVGEGNSSGQDAMDNFTDGDEAVDIAVRSGKVMLVVPSGTPDNEIGQAMSFTGGELELEDGRVLSFEIHDGSVGAQVTIKDHDERDRGIGLSSIPDIPSGV
jgi:hypothetical protein